MNKSDPNGHYAYSNSDGDIAAFVQGEAGGSENDEQSKDASVVVDNIKNAAGLAEEKEKRIQNRLPSIKRFK